MRSLSEAFRELTDLGIKYVVYRGWLNLPLQNDGNIEILTNDENRLIKLLSLTKSLESRDGEYTYKLRLDQEDAEPIKMVIRPAGMNFLPHRFETTVLDRAVLYRDIVKIPDDTNMFFMFTYAMLHYSKTITDKEELVILRSYVEQRVGTGAKSEFNDLPYHE